MHLVVFCEAVLGGTLLLSLLCPSKNQVFALLWRRICLHYMYNHENVISNLVIGVQLRICPRSVAEWLECRAEGYVPVARVQNPSQLMMIKSFRL